MELQIEWTRESSNSMDIRDIGEELQVGGKGEDKVGKKDND